VRKASVVGDPRIDDSAFSLRQKAPGSLRGCLSPNMLCRSSMAHHILQMGITYAPAISHSMVTTSSVEGSMGSHDPPRSMEINQVTTPRQAR
jgi:hypothetical protein